MAVGRRSFLALLGLGGVAAPVALPTFGKAVAQKGLLAQGAAIGGSTGKYYGGPDALDPVNYATRSIGESLRKQALEDFLGHLINDQKEAELRRNRFHDVSVDNYILPSWSTTFRNHMIRKEYDARCEAAKSIRETIQEKMKTFVGFNDDSSKMYDPNVNQASTRSRY